MSAASFKRIHNSKLNALKSIFATLHISAMGAEKVSDLVEKFRQV